MSLSNIFKITLLVTLLIKLTLAFIIPLSGDEAYFLLWGQYPDLGYYDHPPMVGWVLHLMLYLGHAEVVLRLPVILTYPLIGYGIYRLLKPLDEDKAALIAILFLISPINILNVAITTDTTLILFSFLSFAALYKALQKNHYGWYALAGIFFGLAFLSKYFAVLLGLTYLVYLILTAKSKQKTLGFALLYLASLPFALLNLYWNYTHCWDNIMFNLYNRNESAHFSFRTIVMFLGVQLYLMTPPLAYYAIKKRNELKQVFKGEQLQLFLFVFLVPMTLFALLSLVRVVGMHWVLSFYPALYLLLYKLLSRKELTSVLKFMAWFSGLHLAAILVIANMPMETWKSNKLYNGVVMSFEHNKIVEQLRPYEQQQFLLSTDGYSPSATMSYYYGSRFFVFGEDGFHARHDDILTDFREFNGRNILILRKSEPDMQEYIPYFDRVETKNFTLREATFYLVLGYNFNYEKYREGVLRQIKNKYYKIPAYLPVGACNFCERYFPEECKPALK